MYILFYEDSDFEYSADIAMGIYSSVEKVEAAVSRLVMAHRSRNNFFYREAFLDQDFEGNLNSIDIFMANT